MQHCYIGNLFVLASVATNEFGRAKGFVDGSLVICALFNPLWIDLINVTFEGDYAKFEYLMLFLAIFSLVFPVLLYFYWFKYKDEDIYRARGQKIEGEIRDDGKIYDNHVCDHEEADESSRDLQNSNKVN